MSILNESSLPGPSPALPVEAGVGAPVRTSPAAAFITDLTWQDIPEPVARRAALCLMDTLAAMLAGRTTASSRIAAELAASWWPHGESRLIMNGVGVASHAAAFANAVAANAVDIDDCGIYTWGHPGAQVVPTALALAEEHHLSGRELLTAIVVGYEVAFRAGRCMNFAQSQIASGERTFRACGSWGSLACAAIACHVLGLGQEATRHALGIAEYNSPDLPMMRDLDTPGMVKHGVGPGALTGLMSAELARRGFTGIVSSLDLDTFRPFVEDFGTHYLLPHGITWKRFSSCAWTHPALLAIVSLRHDHDIDATRIRQIVVETYPDAVRLGTRLPTTTEEAQFNMAWPIAAFIVDGQVGPAQVLEPRLRSPEVVALAERVEVRTSAELSRRYYQSEVNDPEGSDSAIVTITLDDGTVLSSGRVDNILYPEPAWGVEEMRHKFAWLASDHLSPKAVENVMDRLQHLESVDDVAVVLADLISSLVPIGSGTA